MKSYNKCSEKIRDLKPSSEQIFSENKRWVRPESIQSMIVKLDDETAVKSKLPWLQCVNRRIIMVFKYLTKKMI